MDEIRKWNRAKMTMVFRLPSIVRHIEEDGPQRWTLGTAEWIAKVEQRFGEESGPQLGTTAH